MATLINCPYCSAGITIEPQHIGLVLKCPACQKDFLLPDPRKQPWKPQTKGLLIGLAFHLVFFCILAVLLGGLHGESFMGWMIVLAGMVLYFPIALLCLAMGGGGGGMIVALVFFFLGGTYYALLGFGIGHLVGAIRRRRSRRNRE